MAAEGKSIVGDRKVKEDGTVVSKPVADQLQGTGKGESIFGLELNDTVFGNAGDDVISGGTTGTKRSDKDAIYGGTGDDQLFGGDDDDQLCGGDGLADNDDVSDDTGSGQDGNDTISGGGGDDTFGGGAGDDVIGGDDGHDVLIGDQGDDTIGGFAGDDTIDLIGGSAAKERNQASGGEGDDTIISGAGRDRCHGGAGDDLFKQYERGNADIWIGAAGWDVIEYNLFDEGGEFDEKNGGVKIVEDEDGKANAYKGDVIEGVEEFRLSFYSDDVTLSYGFSDSVGPMKFCLHIVGTFGFVGGGGDTVRIENSPAAEIPKGARGAWVEGGSKGDKFFGADLNDQLDGYAGADLLDGGGGDDQLDGGTGNDTLAGGEGEDEFFDGLGADRLIGGGGADSFLLGYATSAKERRADKDTLAYQDEKDSGATFKTRDSVIGFDFEYDKIDLELIDASGRNGPREAFQLVDKYGGRSGELYIEKAQGIDLYTLHMDTDGDKKDDMQISIFAGSSKGFGDLSWVVL